MLFREMHAISPSARTLWSLGRVHYERGDYVTAIEYLTRANDDPRRPLDETQRREVGALRDRALALIGELELSVQPEDATVLVDDVEHPGRVVRLDPGDHVLRFEAPEHETTTRRVVVRGGERRTLSVALTPRAGEGLGSEAAAPRDVHLEVEVETPGLRLHLQPLNPGTSSTRSGPMDLVCAGPCEATLQTGTYVAGVSRGADDPPTRALMPIEISADSRARLRYEDRTGTRVTLMTIGGVLLGLAIAGATWGLVDELENVSPDESAPQIVGFVGGAIVGVVGITMLTFGALIGDGASVEVSPR